MYNTTLNLVINFHGDDRLKVIQYIIVAQGFWQHINVKTSHKPFGICVEVID